MFLGALFEWSIVLLFLVYILTYRYLGLPSTNELFALFQKGFENYGLLFLFFGLVLEGLFVVGLYFPGSAIAIMAVITMGHTYTDVFFIILVGTIAIVSVNIINYLLGRYGYYKILERFGAQGSIERMGNRFQKNQKRVIFLFSSSPNFSAITSIYAGIVRVKFSEYIRWLSLCVLFWISLVTGLVYIFLGDYDITSASNVQWYALGILIAWALWESIGSFQVEK